jgi:CheY-like chemotaxis protein
MQALGPSVLVVEDDLAVRKMVTQVLCEEGYSVLEAGDGLEAIRIIDQDLRLARQRSVVLLDLRLPTVDGIGVLYHLAAHDDPVSVVAMSANRDLLASALSAGARGAVCKPFDLEDLLSTIAAYCPQLDQASGF